MIRIWVTSFHSTPRTLHPECQSHVGGDEEFLSSSGSADWTYRQRTREQLTDEFARAGVSKRENLRDDQPRARTTRRQHRETLLAPWRGPDEFETPANLPRPTRLGEPLWLDPYPDALLEGVADLAPGGEARYEQKEAIALAFVAGLQHLPARQRAVLVLRDVMGFAAAEVAEMLETSEASVNSALQRARVTLEARLPVARERPPLPRSPQERRVVGEFAQAFEDGDVEGIVALLTDDALLTMPPQPLEYEGPATIGAFLANRFASHAGRRAHCVWTRANNQPAFGHYIDDRHAPVARCTGVVVLTLDGERIAALTRFGDTALLRHFGLPRILPR